MAGITLPIQSAVIVQLVVLALTIAGLWIGAELFVDATVKLARRIKLSELVIGLTVVAMGTSAPELIVSVDAALAGLGNIAVANVIGSNIYNLAFILGIVALIQFIPIERTLVRRDGIVLIVTTLLGFAVIFDLTVTRVEGVLLFGSFVIYIFYLIRTGSTLESATEGGADVQEAVHVTANPEFRGRDALRLVGGLALVLVSGHFLVEAATTIARLAGISEWVIGGTIVAAGTSTPEFAVSLIALRRESIGVSVGNVIGSNIYNLIGILGLAALIRPMTVDPEAIGTMVWLTAIALLLVAALWTERQLSRAEGGVFASSELLRWVLNLLG